MNRLLFPCLALLVLPACGEDAPAPTPLVEDPLADCTRDAVEADLQSFSPMSGPGVRADGTLAPGRYVVSSTYLRMRPEPAAQARFQELMGPISQALQAQPGLVALQLAASERCGTARTLSVWQDEAAMYGFVTGDAHMAAVRAVGEVSRGGSIVTHWADDAQGVSWAKAAQQLGADTGPFY
jgi:heme-degrading monooxygenase HmoA